MCIDIRPWMCINIIAMKYAILRKYELVIKMSYSSPNTWKNKILAKKHHIDNNYSPETSRKFRIHPAEWP